MDNNQANQQLNHQQNLCKKNCGFFANSVFDGYCSKCYKEHVKRQNTGSASGINMASSSSSSTSNSSSSQQQPIEPIPTTTVEQQQQITVESAAVAAATSENVVEPVVAVTVVPALPLVDVVKSSPTVPIDIKKSVASGSVSDDVAGSVDLMASSCSSSVGCGAQSLSPTDNDKKTPTKKSTRCNLDSCRRKVGLTGYDCRCGGMYCWEHRYSDKHNCQFDYKEHGQEQIRKCNPVVVGEKIQKL